MNTEYRADIDGLRAVAVALVVAFHAFPTVMPGGFIGVDVFFVISGYLITALILSELGNSSFSFARFYARRVRRIFPALAFVLIIVLAFGWWRLPPVRYQTLGLQTIAGALFFPNFLSWHEAGYFNAAAITKPLLHLWSLGVEEQFYLVWPVLLMMLRGRRLVSGLFLIVVGSFAYSVYASLHDPDAAFYAPWSRLWELGIGGILAAANWCRKDHDLLSLSGVLLIIGSAMVLKGTSPFPGALALLPVAGAALVIVFPSRLLATRWPVSVGLISYPLYLWHWPLLSFAATAGLTSSPTKAALVIASLVLAWLTTALVEHPLRFGRLRALGVPASLVVMTIVAGIATLVWSRGGLLGQPYPEEIQPVLATMQFKPNAENVFRCWMPAPAGFEKYPADCGLGDTLVWGDSFAGRLYAGLTHDGVKVGEFVGDGCPPALNVGSRICIERNAAIFSKIAELRPKRIILFAIWRRYVGRGLDDKPGGGLATTLRELKKFGSEIVVIGEMPYWAPDLPMQVYDFWRWNGHLPDRLMINPQSNRAMDAVIARASAAADVPFISAFDALCNAQGCLTHTSESKSELLTWDYGHLTVAGARLVVKLLHLD